MALLSEAALTDAYTTSNKRLRRVALLYVRAEDADDVVQDAFVRALENGARFRGGSTLYTWLHRIVTNRGIDCARRERRERLHVERERQEVTTPKATCIESQALRTALNALSGSSRSLCVLHYEAGFTLPELSLMLKLPVGTLKSRLFRIRRDISDALALRFATDGCLGRARRRTHSKLN